MERTKLPEISLLFMQNELIDHHDCQRKKLYDYLQAIDMLVRPLDFQKAGVPLIHSLSIPPKLSVGILISRET